MTQAVYFAMNVTKNAFDQIVKGPENGPRTLTNTFLVIAEA